MERLDIDFIDPLDDGRATCMPLDVYSDISADLEHTHFTLAK